MISEFLKIVITKKPTKKAMCTIIGSIALFICFYLPDIFKFFCIYLVFKMLDDQQHIVSFVHIMHTLSSL